MITVYGAPPTRVLRFCWMLELNVSPVGFVP
jgi:hypothetical protein